MLFGSNFVCGNVAQHDNQGLSWPHHEGGTSASSTTESLSLNLAMADSKILLDTMVSSWWNKLSKDKTDSDKEIIFEKDGQVIHVITIGENIASVSHVFVSMNKLRIQGIHI